MVDSLDFLDFFPKTPRVKGSRLGFLFTPGRSHLSPPPGTLRKPGRPKSGRFSWNSLPAPKRTLPWFLHSILCIAILRLFESYLSVPFFTRELRPGNFCFFTHFSSGGPFWLKKHSSLRTSLFSFLHLLSCDVAFVPLFTWGCWPFFRTDFFKQSSKTRLTCKNWIEFHFFLAPLTSFQRKT